MDNLQKVKQILLLGFLVLTCFGCVKPLREGGSSWRITAATPENGFCKTGMKMILEEDRLKMVSGTSTTDFPIIQGDGRLLADTGMAKILFSVVTTSDSTMVWEELYGPAPLVIHFAVIRDR